MKTQVLEWREGNSAIFFRLTWSWFTACISALTLNGWFPTASTTPDSGYSAKGWGQDRLLLLFSHCSLQLQSITVIGRVISATGSPSSPWRPPSARPRQYPGGPVVAGPLDPPHGSWNHNLKSKVEVWVGWLCECWLCNGKICLVSVALN